MSPWRQPDKKKISPCPPASTTLASFNIFNCSGVFANASLPRSIADAKTLLKSGSVRITRWVPLAIPLATDKIVPSTGCVTAR